MRLLRAALLFGIMCQTQTAGAACGVDPCLNADVQTLRDDVAVLRSAVNSMRNDIVAADFSANAAAIQHALWVNAGLLMILIATQGRPGKYPGK